MHENDLISVKTANGDIDILLAIKDLNERKEISNLEDNLSANDNKINSLLLIYTPQHPKVIQAYELQESLEYQLQHILEEVIERKVFELSNSTHITTTTITTFCSSNKPMNFWKHCNFRV